MSKIKLFLGASILLLSVQVSAELVDNGDWTTDTASGLDWLDLNLTYGMSVDTASSTYSGWRLATTTEYDDLFYKIFPNYEGNIGDAYDSNINDDYDKHASQLETFFSLFGEAPPRPILDPGWSRVQAFFLAESTGLDLMQLNLFRLQENVRIDPHDYRGYTNDDTGGAAGLFLVRATTIPPDTFVNGGFEEPTGIGTYEHRNGDELPGWNLFSTYKGTVHFDTDYAPVSEGSQAVQIEVPGDWISQSISTVIGREYRVSFDLSAYPIYGGPNLGYTLCNPYCDSILGVSVGSESEVFDGSSEEYVTHTLLFTADSTVSTLRFENPFILDINDEWGNYPHLDNVSISPVSVPVTIDIKPGKVPNDVNLKSNGILPVAVLGSIDFDATQIVFSTVTFGPAGATPTHDGHVRDVNRDGFPDMVFHFKTQETGIACGDTEATLTGQISDGIQFTGTDSVNTVRCKYAIGNTGPAGGIVFYVMDEGIHGLEAAPVDQAIPFAPGVEWGCFGDALTGADGTAIGTGQQNTADILAPAPSGCNTRPIAASVAADYAGPDGNSLGEWFLPSKDELNELYLNRGVVGGFASSDYWSSSEIGFEAWYQHLGDGDVSGGAKWRTSGVRAVRAF